VYEKNLAMGYITIAICPQPADTDGYTDVWSADAVEVVTKGECKNRPEK